MSLETQVADLTIATTNLTTTVVAQQLTLDARIQKIIGAAPAALDTLGEIAAQLASDQNAAGVLTATVATKASQSTTYTKTEVNDLLTSYAANHTQQIITANYILMTDDSGSSFIIQNGNTAITITVPVNLPKNMQASFIQQGTGDVTFVASGTLLKSAYNMLKIKGQNFGAYIEQVGSTNTYQLIGKMKS